MCLGPISRTITSWEKENLISNQEQPDEISDELKNIQEKLDRIKEKPYSTLINPTVLAFSITSVSILVLVFSQIENSKYYLLRANSFHTCGMELSRLYNELQNFKSYMKDASKEIKMNFTEELQNRYQELLTRYENHAPIDNLYFRSKNTDYYQEQKLFKWLLIKIEYAVVTRLLYLVIIFSPIIFFVYLVIVSRQFSDLVKVRIPFLADWPLWTSLCHPFRTYSVTRFLINVPIINNNCAFLNSSNKEVMLSLSIHLECLSRMFAGEPAWRQTGLSMATFKNRSLLG